MKPFDLGALTLKSELDRYQPIAFGKEMRKHFAFIDGWHNMNHASFGASPKVLNDKARQLRDTCELSPDHFIFYQYPRLLDEAREAIADFLEVSLSTIVFVPNASSGTNTILRNLVWNPDSKDEILQFSYVYGALGKTAEYICELSGDLVDVRTIAVTFPIEDDDLVQHFRDGIQASRAAGKRPRIAMFDTIASHPGVRIPFEALTAVCREEGILSLIDGAHGVGHIPLDLSVLDPDFFVSNLHKWLFVPRSCAVLYTPERNQALLRSAVPTSHGYVPRPNRQVNRNPLPPSYKSPYVVLFEFVATLDSSPYLCVPEAIRWRKEACGGEQNILSYASKLAREGGRRVAEILGTRVLKNSNGTLANCCLTNVLLPIMVGEGEVAAAAAEADGKVLIPTEHDDAVANWIKATSVTNCQSFLFAYPFQGEIWVRLSGQIYLDMEDFEWAGQRLRELCERVGRQEYLFEAK